jgi:uncharacterized membrane protein
MIEPPADSDAPPERPAAVLFDAVLYPHRSLPPKGFAILMGALCAISFAAGMVFVLHGAWPVLGFFGLDVLAVYVAFRLSYRSGRMFEAVTLTEGALTVRRVDWRGREQRWSFQPYWLRVEERRPAGRSGHLMLTSHGRILEFARFLTPDERTAFARELGAALAALRTRPQPA